MTDDERAQRGRRAHNEFQQLDAAFQSCSDEIMVKLLRTPIGQPDAILQLHMAAQNLASVRKALLAIAQDGLLAETAVAQSGLLPAD